MPTHKILCFVFLKHKENDPDMLAPLLDDEDELYKYTAIAVYKVFNCKSRHGVSLSVAVNMMYANFGSRPAPFKSSIFTGPCYPASALFFRARNIVLLSVRLSSRPTM